MLKKFGMAALALIVSLGVVSIGEAAQESESQNNYCCRGSYCYNRSVDRNADGDINCGEYCCDGQRGCW